MAPRRLSRSLIVSSRREVGVNTVWMSTLEVEGGDGGTDLHTRSKNTLGTCIFNERVG